MQLHLLHPEIPSCDDCQRWLYYPDWKPYIKAGKREPRPPGLPLPCGRCPKSMGTGRPNPGAELSLPNRMTLLLYWQVKAGLPVPNDPVACRNLGLIEAVVRRIDSQRGDISNLAGLMAGLLGGGTRNAGTRKR